MTTKKELRHDNVELRKHVERAIRELERFGGELAEIVAGRDDGEARALRIVARRARLVAEELGEELRVGLDAETVGLLLRFFRHEYTRKAIGGMIAGFAAKYGPGTLVDTAELAIGAVDEVLSVLGGLGGEDLAGSSASRSRLNLEQGGSLLVEDGEGPAISRSATVNPETIQVRGEVPAATPVTGMPDVDSDSPESMMVDTLSDAQQEGVLGGLGRGPLGQEALGGAGGADSDPEHRVRYRPAPESAPAGGNESADQVDPITDSRGADEAS